MTTPVHLQHSQEKTGAFFLSPAKKFHSPSSWISQFCTDSNHFYLVLLSLIQKFKTQSTSTNIIPFIFFPSSSIHSAQQRNWKQKPQRNIKTSTTSHIALILPKLEGSPRISWTTFTTHNRGDPAPKMLSVQAFCQGLSFPTAENSPSFGETNQTPSKDYFLAALSSSLQCWPLLQVLLYSIWRNSHMFRWAEVLFFGFWLHWTLVFWRCIRDLKETLK